MIDETAAASEPDTPRPKNIQPMARYAAGGPYGIQIVDADSTETAGSVKAGLSRR